MQSKNSRMIVALFYVGQRRRSDSGPQVSCAGRLGANNALSASKAAAGPASAHASRSALESIGDISRIFLAVSSFLSSR